MSEASTAPVPHVVVWSDVHCPWAAITVHRLRRARRELGLDVVLEHRAWPLEWVNNAGIPRWIVEPETAALAEQERELFSRYEHWSWPSTALPAFELVAAARRVGGHALAEEVDYHVRLAFFRDSVDISVRAGLETILEATGRDSPETAARMADVLWVWEHDAVRGDVVADYRESASVEVIGSPHVVWPDGSSTHNPGMDDHERLRGIPRLGHVDPDAVRRLLAARCGAPRMA